MEGRVIDAAEWFCYPPFGTVDIKKFADVEYRIEGTHGLGQEIYDQVYKCYPVFLDMQQRRYPYFQNTLYDLLNDFNRQFGAVYSLLTETKPQLVLFGNIPHGGHDLLLYEVARALGVKTMILFQVPVCARFFILSDLEDFGVFRSHPNSDAEGLLPIPEIKTPFYAHVPPKRPGSLLRDLKTIDR